MQISPFSHFQPTLTTWPQMTFDLGIWPLTAWTYEGSHIISINQVWFQSDFNFSNEATFTFSAYNSTSDDLWPWYVTFVLINKWGFPCCIYDPTLVEIHQSMWKVQPNVNLFSQQTTTDNSGQSDPYVSFLLRQVTQKQKQAKDFCTKWWNLCLLLPMNTDNLLLSLFLIA